MKDSSSSIKIWFGQRVQTLRKERGFSQEELALKIGLDRTYISGIERGERNPALVNVDKIAKGLSVTLSELLMK